MDNLPDSFKFEGPFRYNMLDLGILVCSMLYYHFVLTQSINCDLILT